MILHAAQGSGQFCMDKCNRLVVVVGGGGSEQTETPAMTDTLRLFWGLILKSFYLPT